ncbi:hypothetical protein APHAL10511_006934, partial [Amanita phalloides]
AEVTSPPEGSDSLAEAMDIVADDFQRLQAMADADHEASNMKCRKDLTANI